MWQLPPTDDRDGGLVLSLVDFSELPILVRLRRSSVTADSVDDADDEIELQQLVDDVKVRPVDLLCSKSDSEVLRDKKSKQIVGLRPPMCSQILGRSTLMRIN